MGSKTKMLLSVLAVGGAIAIAMSTWALNPRTVAPVPSASRKQPTQAESSERSFADLDFARKSLLYHQLAAWFAEKAISDASTSEVRRIAEEIYSRETEKAAAFAALLTTWNESYVNLTDFPEANGCLGYPTFTGMSPHAEVASYRASKGMEVDSRFLALLLAHHQKGSTLSEIEGRAVRQRDLVLLKPSSLEGYQGEIELIESLQKDI